jgi:hypothetical protein
VKSEIEEDESNNVPGRQLGLSIKPPTAIIYKTSGMKKRASKKLRNLQKFSQQMSDKMLVEKISNVR